MQLSDHSRGEREEERLVNIYKVKFIQSSKVLPKMVFAFRNTEQKQTLLQVLVFVPVFVDHFTSALPESACGSRVAWQRSGVTI